MSTTTIPTQIRIDAATKKQANELFKELGTDMSTAVNMFLRQCINTGSIPFRIRKPRYNRETEEAIEEARRISRDPNTPKYETVEELMAALEAE